MLPITPMRVHDHHDTAVVVGSDGGLIGLGKDGQVTNILRPMTNPISSSILLDGHLIASWNFYDTNTSSYMGLIPKGFFVDLYYKDEFLEKRKVYDHSESYAESLAENWVDGIISNPSG